MRALAVLLALCAVYAKDGRSESGPRARGRKHSGPGGDEQTFFTPPPPSAYQQQFDHRRFDQPASQGSDYYGPPQNQHQRFSARDGPGSGESSGSRQKGKEDPGIDPADVVPEYTRSLAHKALVATSSTMSASLLFHLVSKLIFSHANLLVSLVLASFCGLSCFTNGDLSRFSKALGVFGLLISRRTKPGKFVLHSLKGLRSLLMLSARQPFPPAENPWKYNEPPRGAGIPFSMMNAMIGVVVTGFFTGWSVAKLIPFFPGWLGSIGCAVVFGYQCTLADARGDMFRYLGYAVNALLSEVTTTADDVFLREKTSILLGRIFALVSRLDQKYQVIEKLKAVIAGLVGQLTTIVNRVQKDMEQPPQRP